MNAIKRPLALLLATGALSIGPTLVACSGNDDGPGEFLEEVQDEAHDALDEVEDEVDDHT